MKAEYTFAWLAWAGVLLWAEFLAAPDFASTLYVVALVLFMMIEGIAVGRPKGGDTLSEHVWAAYGGMPARIPLLVGCALFFGVRIYELGRGVIPGPWGVDIGRAVLVWGVIGWLIPHFIGRGRHG